MGKSNRIRVNKATAPKKPTAAKQRNNKGMPSWLMTVLTIVIAAAILIGVALSLLSENGVFGRWNTIVKTDNYKVNANMMSYYFYTNYNEFYSQYSSYLGDMLDTSVSLKDQYYSEATDTTPAVSWYDFFMEQTVESVKSLLYYCEEADVLGVKLDDADLEEIDAAIASIETQAATYGYSTNAYISNMYGPGVQKTDVRKAMKLSALANKCMTQISSDLEGKISDERIDAGYAADPKAYNVIDYSSYAFTVSYTDIAKKVLGENYTDSDLTAKKDDVLAAYKDAIKEAVDKANAIKGETGVITEETFLKATLTDLAEKEFETAYKAAAIADEDKLSDENYATVKAGMVAEIVTEIMEDKETAADAVKDLKAYGVDVSETFGKTLNSIKTTVFDKAHDQKHGCETDKAAYAESNDFLTWAFAEGRAIGDAHVIQTGDGAKEDDTFASPTTATVTVYLLRAPQYQDDAKTRNASYMVFTNKSSAESAIADLAAMGSVTKEAFEAYAEASATASAHSTMTDYTEGSLGSDSFDAWLFDGTRLPGHITTTPLALDDSTYVVMFYVGEGIPTWRANVKSAILEADYESYVTDMTAKYEPTVKVQESLDNVVKA